MTSFLKFSQLHRQARPLLLGNIWDVQSAKLFEANGYAAIGTSSQAVARSLGYEDGEQIPFASLLQLAKRVVEVVGIPLSVDMEGGYSRTTGGIITNIEKLHDAGVVGINLEDTIAGATRSLQPTPVFKMTIAAIATHIRRNNLNIFLNVRTDGFLLGMPTALSETLSRMKSYEEAGADGIFVPCITASDDIAAVVNATTLPINVMCMPGLPDLEALGSLGVKRVSMGSFFFQKVYDIAGSLSRVVSNDSNFSSILS